MAAPLGGIDIGGTKILVCRGDAEGHVQWTDSFATDPEASPGELLAEASQRLLDGGTIAALGVTCPGPFFRRTQTFEKPPNMPRWHGFELGSWLSSHVPGIPFSAKNDANALAIAEHRWGAGRSVSTLVFFTMSTGMGAGLVLDGRPYEGARGFAGEIGHLRLSDEGPIGFGKRGSVEGFLSGPGLAQLAAEEVRIARQRGESTELFEVASLDAKALCAAAQRGDRVARRATDRAGARLGQLMAILVDVLEPELFVLGTIGRAYPELFIEPAMQVVHREALALSTTDLRIEPSALDDHAAQSALVLAALASEARDR
ncbi:MAG: ROK family protein [Planctomycetes bacterium]|nr:ROK family protein [Planctomycetota bacterium]